MKFVLRQPPRTAEELSEAQAWAVLEPHWIEILRRCRAHDWAEPLARLKNVAIDTNWHDTCRHFAGMATDGTKLVLAPQLAKMPVATIDAILAHEAGHCADLTQPGVFWFRPSSPYSSASPLSRNSNGVLWQLDPDLTGHRCKTIRNWRDRSDDEVERVADALGEIILGAKIGYVGHPGCLVQSAHKGIDRPKGLR